MEMQIILMELIESFEFSPAPGNIEILRVPAGLMSPMYGFDLSIEIHSY